MNVGVYGDSWVWDWTKGQRFATEPSEFCEALKRHGHSVTNYCMPGTCLNTSKTIINATHEQHECVVVIATCPYRILGNAVIECIDGMWFSDWDPMNYHRRLDLKFRNYTPQQHMDWYEQTQTEWQQCLPQGKTIVLGGAGPIKTLLHPGINHVKKHLSKLDDYTSGYHSQCYAWGKAAINMHWNPQFVGMVADHVEAIESGSVGDPYHLITSELEQLAVSVHDLINKHVHQKP